MYKDTILTLQDSFTVTFANMFSQVGMFLPKFVAAIFVVLVLRTAIAKWLKSLIVKLLELSFLRISKGLQDTPHWRYF
jgi:hypothetical protein